MADAAAVSQYPAPPHFYKLYRDGPAAGPPPPPPPDGEVSVFGAPLNLVGRAALGPRRRSRVSAAPLSPAFAMGCTCRRACHSLPPLQQNEPLVPPLEVGALFATQPDGTIGEGCGGAKERRGHQAVARRRRAGVRSAGRPRKGCPHKRAPAGPPTTAPAPPPTPALPPDSKAELLKLNQALLVLFLELLSVLVEQPSAYAETLTRVIAALQNMQHLVNLRRPEQVRRSPARAARAAAAAAPVRRWGRPLLAAATCLTSTHPALRPLPMPPPPLQARHTLEEMLRQQIAKKRDALAGLRREVAGIREQLSAAAAALAAAGGDAAESARQAAPAAPAAMDTS
jgi:hypothetical protein